VWADDENCIPDNAAKEGEKEKNVEANMEDDVSPDNGGKGSEDEEDGVDSVEGEGTRMNEANVKRLQNLSQGWVCQACTREEEPFTCRGRNGCRAR